MAYEYNPLIPLNLQKKQSAATPGDIDRLEGEIDTLAAEMRNKVPKFFTSIDELAVGEIGQYQGETTADFVNGYFYKRQEPVAVEYGETQYTYQSTGFIEIKRGGTLTVKQLYVRQNPEHGYITFTTEQLILCRCASERNYAYVFLFSPDLLIGGDDLPTVTVDNNQYLLFPYVYDRTDVGDEFMDYDNPIQYLGNNTVKYLDYEPQVLYKSAWGINSFIGADLNDNSLLYAWFNNYGCFALPISSDCSQLAFNVLKALPPSDYYYEAETTQEITAYPTSFITQPPFVRVDTQPTDMSNATGVLPLEHGGTGQNSAAQAIQTLLQALNVATSTPDDNTVFVSSVGGAWYKRTFIRVWNYIKNKIYGNQTPADKSILQYNANTNMLQGVPMQPIETASQTNDGILTAYNTKLYISAQNSQSAAYGVMWDTSNPSPDCVRIGNMTNHALLPVQAQMVGGVLADDLTFTEFDNQDDWTQASQALDGSDGQVMVRIPQHWVKFETVGTWNVVWMSAIEIAGFTKVPLMYVSAFKAALDRTDPTTPKLASVVNTSTAFRGGDNTDAWDNTYRSLLGFPVSNISLTDFRQYARNRAAGTAWNCMTYSAQRALYWLFVVEYATLNSQKEYNAAKDVNGYSQGGLGAGVTGPWSSSAWITFNNQNPIIPCGYLVEYGNMTAVKNITISDSNGNVLTTETNTYRGIQSPFGDIWDWCDGVLFDVQSDNEGGVTTCYITNDPANFSSLDYSQYTKIGTMPRTNGMIKNIFSQGEIICKAQGASSLTYYCDYYWGENLPPSGVSLRGFRTGGFALNEGYNGLLCGNSLSTPNIINNYTGSRLVAHPTT